MSAVFVAGTPAGAGAPGPAELGAALQDLLVAPSDRCQESDLDGPALAPFYTGAARRPLWVDESGPRPRADRLRAVLERADTHGLPRARYGVDRIAARWVARTSTERACLDLLLTAAFERYASDLATGWLSPREADRQWHLPPPSRFDAVAALGQGGLDAVPTSDLERLAPTYGLYDRLRAGLARYRRLAEEGGWPTALPAPPIDAADDAWTALLRARLARENDVDPTASSRGDDAALAEGVRRFQRRHGLAADGVVGPRTLAALNTPVEVRVAQLRRALERLRWLPRALGDHYVLVNSGGFDLSVLEHDRIVLGMRVIVGTVDQQTPSFAATLRTLTINPYWNVPQRIARDRLVPRERRSPGYLAAGGFRVRDPGTGRWREPDAAVLAGPTPVIRQEPGPRNLMGRLSFAFPNPFDIFLHDTPDRSLFERDVRTCSEGCVRIERPMALALHALRRAPEWTEARVQAEIDALRHRVLTLPEPVPVYVVYLPTWVDETGLAHFRADHYGREQALAAAFPPRP